MKIIVKPHRIIINNDKLVNEREVNVSKCYFEFDKEITDDFVKEAYFTFKGNTYKQLIQNNECSFPQEVLTDKGQIEIGVVAYKIDNELIRYNPRPAYFNTLLGSLKDDVENTEEITPTDKEQMEQAINNGLVEIDNALTDLQEKVDSGYFKGEKGDTGERGPQGLTGETGPQGERGLTGETGPQGEKGETGATGQAGRDGYVQYTAGNNITIENNVISAEVPEIDLSDYYTKDDIDLKYGEIFKIQLSSVFNLEFNSSKSISSEDLPLFLPIMQYMNKNRLSTPVLFLTSTKKYSSTDSVSIHVYAPIQKKQVGNQFNVDFTASSPNRLTENSKNVVSLSLHVTYNIDTDSIVSANITKNQFEFVDTSSEQTISRKKTFTVLPESSVTPTTDNQLANKKYVDDAIASAITTTLGGSY